RGVLALGAAEHPDAHDLLGARVVGDVQRCGGLNHGLAPHASCGRSMSFSTRQRLSRERGRLSTISTRSPTLYSFFSSCALYLVRLVMYLPYLACARRRSTITTRVFDILSLVTTPMNSRR